MAYIKYDRISAVGAIERLLDANVAEYGLPDLFVEQLRTLQIIYGQEEVDESLTYVQKRRQIKQ